MSDPLEDAVRAAEVRIEDVNRRLRETRGAIELFAELGAAHEARATADRALGEARGEEVAVPYPWDPPWDRGAPMPHVVSGNGHTLLVYLARDPDPAWDGTTASVIDPGALRPQPLVLVEVERCYAHRFGGPNDEVFDGHRLARRGFDGYGAFEIRRSAWLAEEKATNRVHRQYSDAQWADRRHFLLAFHDEVFECLARGFRIERTQASFQQILARMVERIVR